MHRLLALAGVVFFLPHLNAADTPMARPVAELVRDLAANDFAVRAAAIRAIEARGPDALEEVRRHKDHPDPEVRRLIEQWIPRFENEARVRPRRVTLQLIDRPLSEAVAQLAKQTGYSIELAADEKLTRRRCTIRLEQATFWEALEQIGKAGQVEAELDGRQTVTLNPSDSQYPFVSLHGAFRVRATFIDYHASTHRFRTLGPLPRQGQIDEEQKHDSRVLLLRFSVAAEPRLSLGFGADDPTLSEAVDDRGASLLSHPQRPPPRGLSFGFAGDHHVYYLQEEAETRLLAPTPGARGIQRLRGTMPVAFLTRTQTTVLLDNLQDIRGKRLAVGHDHIDIDLFKPLGDGRYSLFVTMNRGWPAPGNQADDLVLQDAQGEPLGIIYRGCFDGDVDRFQAYYLFGPPANGAWIGAPAKLAFVRSEIVEHQVPFEFRELPLP